MNGEWHIREARDEDLDEFVAIKTTAARVAFADCDDQVGLQAWLDQRCDRTFVAGRITIDDGVTLVVERDGQVVAMSQVRLREDEDGPYADLGDLYCREQRVGYGTALLEARLEWARERGCERARCYVFAINRGARSFVEAHGFGEIGTIEASDFPGQQLIRYELVMDTRDEATGAGMDIVMVGAWTAVAFAASY